MPGTTTTTAANTLKSVLEPGYIDATYLNHDLLKYFQGVKKRATSNAYTWAVKAAGKSAAVFTEGSAMPDPGYITWAKPTLSPLYIWCPAQISGHLEDAIANGGAEFDSAFAEFQDSIDSIADLYTTSFLGSTYGLEVAIDSSSSYAGISRGSASYWESLETNHNAKLTMNALITLVEGLVDNDRGANKNNLMWLVPWNQVTNIFELAGVPGMKTFDPRDPAASWGNSSIAGAPVAGIGDMTNTTIALMDMTPANWALPEFRPLSVVWHRNVGDSSIYKVSGGQVLASKNPVKNAKLTNVTA